MSIKPGTGSSFLADCHVAAGTFNWKAAAGTAFISVYVLITIWVFTTGVNLWNAGQRLILARVLVGTGVLMVVTAMSILAGIDR